MTKRIAIEVGVLAFAAFGAAGLWRRVATCADLPPGLMPSLEQAARARFAIPRQVPLRLASDATLPGSCVRRLAFTGAGGRTFRFLLSPDHRYVMGGARDLARPPRPQARRAAPAPTPAAPNFPAQVRISSTVAAALVAGSPPSLGPANAPVALVEFGDFECPFCRQLAQTLSRQVLPKFPGRVRLVWRQFPIGGHPWARPAAELSSCVARTRPAAFWRLHDLLYAIQSQLSAGNLQAWARKSLGVSGGLDWAALDRCAAGAAAAERVAADVALGERAGVRGTPTLFVNQTMIVGGVDAATLESVIAGQLERQHPRIK